MRYNWLKSLSISGFSKGGNIFILGAKIRKRAKIGQGAKRGAILKFENLIQDDLELQMKSNEKKILGIYIGNFETRYP